MFNNFAVPAEQKDLLRFYWFAGNDPDAIIVPYRSTGHNFGLTSSPAVAAFALKFFASQLGDEDKATREYLSCSHYVDDGLDSVDTPEEAVEILMRADVVFANYKIEMHKVVSNSTQVLKCFPEDKRAEPVSELPSDQESTALGVTWNRNSDTLGINPSIPERLFTKRGILSIISSIYDPIGICSPTTIMAKLIQREILSGKSSVLAY